MAQRIEVPGQGIVEFPDDMADNEIAGAIQSNFPELSPPEPEHTGEGFLSGLGASARNVLPEPDSEGYVESLTGMGRSFAGAGRSIALAPEHLDTVIGGLKITQALTDGRPPQVFGENELVTRTSDFILQDVLGIEKPPTKDELLQGELAQEGLKQYSKAAAKIAEARPEDESAALVFDVTTMAMKMIPAVGLGAATKNQNVTLGVMFGQVYAERSGQMMEAGYDAETIESQATASATIEVLTEKIPMGILFKHIGMSGIRKLLNFTVAEGLQEGASAVLQGMFEMGTINPDKTLAEIAREAGYETLVGTIGAPIVGGPVVLAQALQQKGQTPPTDPIVQNAVEQADLTDPAQVAILNQFPEATKSSMETLKPVESKENIPLEGDVNRETMQQLREESQEAWAEVLPGMPREIHEGLSTEALGIDPRAAKESDLQSLRERLQEPGTTYSEALQSVWGPELADAPRELRPTAEGGVAVPSVSSEATPGKGSEFAEADIEQTPDITEGIELEEVTREEYQKHLAPSKPLLTGLSTGKALDRTTSGEAVYLSIADAEKLVTTKPNQADVDKLAQKIKNEGGLKEPIEIGENQAGKIEVEDGHHRIAAMKQLGYDRIPVKVEADYFEKGMHPRLIAQITKSKPVTKKKMAKKKAIKKEPDSTKQVTTLIKLADGLEKQIDAKLNPATAEQNMTQRRIRIMNSMRLDGEQLQRVQQILRGIAGQMESGKETVLSGVKNKKQVSTLEVYSRPEYDWAKDYERINEEAKKSLKSAGITKQNYKKALKATSDLVTGITPEQEETNKLRELEQSLVGTKIPGFFPTPAETADRLVELAEIEPGMVVLEPSAGSGNLAEAIQKGAPNASLTVNEINGTLAEVLRAKGYTVTQTDFLEMEGEYDRIVMNPPFEKGQDIQHVIHAYSLLRSGGRLVSIVGESAFTLTNKKSESFRGWIDELGGETEDLPSGTFQGAKLVRTTGVKSRILILDKEGRTAAEPKGINLYSGLPVEEMYDFAKLAMKNLKDSLGIPEGKYEPIDIRKPEKAKQPGPLTPIKSPSNVAKKYPELQPYFDDAEIAHETQEKLRVSFQKRLKKVNDLVSKKEQQMFTEIRIAEDMLGQEFTEAELRTSYQASDDLIKAHKLLRSAYNHALHMANTLRELRGKTLVNRRTGYLPHFFHNWFIVQDDSVIGSARTLREAVSFANKQARAGHKMKIRPKEFHFPDEMTQAAVVGDGQFFRLRNNLEKSFELSTEEAAELLGGIARMRGRSRFIGNFMQRKNVPGWEKNLAWVDRHYFNMMSRYAALDTFKRKAISRFEHQFGSFEKEYKGMPQYIKNYINDINGNPTHIEELFNAWLLNTPALGKFLGKYLGDRPSIQLAGTTTNAVAIAKLGLYNISSALVNATQFINANALIGTKWTSVGIAHATVIDAEILKRKLGATPKTKEDIGILKQAGVDVQLGLESGAGYSRTAQMGKVFRATTFFFTGVERYLRQSTTLGAYYKGRSEGMTKEEAIKYAENINRRVNFDYSVVDAPAFIRRSGPLGQVLFQFKKFPVKQTEFILSLKGAEHAKFWLPILLIAGYYGIPGMEALINLLRGLFDWDLEKEFKKELMTWAGDDPAKRRIAITILYGVLANPELGGVDISRRVGGGDFIPSDMRDLYGPAFSSVGRAAQMAGEEQWIEVLRALATAPGNVALAIANDTDLRSPYDRMRKITEATPSIRVKKSLGLRPIEEAMESDVARIIGYESRKQQRIRTRVIDDIILGSQENDPERVTGAAVRLKEAGIVITPQMIENEAKNKGIGRADRAILAASVGVLAETYGVVKFYKAGKKESE